MCWKLYVWQGLFFHVEKGQDGKIYVNNRTGSKHLLSAFHLQADFDFFIAQISLFSNVCKVRVSLLFNFIMYTTLVGY